MPLNGTYTGLKLSVADWLHRTDLTSQIPDFITLAEAACNNGDPELNISPLRTASQEFLWVSTSTVPAVTVANSQYVTLPDDFCDFRRLVLYYGGGQTYRRELKQANIVPMTTTDRAMVASIPERYCVVGGRLYLDPIPNAAYNLEGDGYSEIPPLADGQPGDTNWLLTMAPQVYLFGACAYASPWLMADARAKMWASGFASGIAAVQRRDAKLRFDNAILTTDVPQATGRGFNIITGY